MFLSGKVTHFSMKQLSSNQYFTNCRKHKIPETMGEKEHLMYRQMFLHITLRHGFPP